MNDQYKSLERAILEGQIQIVRDNLKDLMDLSVQLKDIFTDEIALIETILKDMEKKVESV